MWGTSTEVGQGFPRPATRTGSCQFFRLSLRNRGSDTIAEDTTGLGCRMPRKQAGPKLETSSRLVHFQSAGGYCVGYRRGKDILSLVQLWTLWSRPTCQVRCALVLILAQLSYAWIRKLVFKVFLITREFMANTGPHYFSCSTPFLQMRTSSCNELIRVEKLSLTYYHI